MLSVSVAATSTDGALTSPEYLRRVLASTSYDANTNQAQVDAIAAASKWAVNYVGHPLLAQRYTETLAGYGDQSLMVSRYPVRVIHRLFDSTSTSEATEYCSTDVRVDPDAGLINRDAGFRWTAGEQYHLGGFVAPRSELQPWYADYTAGYVFPGMSTDGALYTTCAGVGLTGSTSTGSTLPADIQHAVALKAKELFENLDGVQSKGIGDLSITYTSESLGNRSPAERLLEPYVKRF